VGVAVKNLRLVDPLSLVEGYMGKMPSLEEAFTTAIAQGKISGTVLMATNETGSFRYSRAFGPRSLHGTEEALKLDAFLVFASFTKLITTIAALQLVERGKWTLDEDVFDILPELKRLPILAEMKEGRAVLTKRENNITLRWVLFSRKRQHHSKHS
jgi:CubicO group peptidase (beta-lactamase class C family)